jgi:predicted alpha/beta hydrolase family esterase
VANNPAAAVRANWRERMNRALETVEGVLLASHNHFECLVITRFHKLRI